MNEPRDPHLQAALHHAPDHDALPPDALSKRILARSRAAVARPAERSENVFERWFGWMSRPAAAGAFGSLLIAGVVGLLWREGPPPEALPGGDRPVAVAPAPATQAPPPPAPAPAPAPAPRDNAAARTTQTRADAAKEKDGDRAIAAAEPRSADQQSRARPRSEIGAAEKPKAAEKLAGERVQPTQPPAPTVAPAVAAAPVAPPLPFPAPAPAPAPPPAGPPAALQKSAESATLAKRSDDAAPREPRREAPVAAADAGAPAAAAPAGVAESASPQRARTAAAAAAPSVGRQAATPDDPLAIPFAALASSANDPAVAALRERLTRLRSATRGQWQRTVLPLGERGEQILDGRGALLGRLLVEQRQVTWQDAAGVTWRAPLADPDAAASPPR